MYGHVHKYDAVFGCYFLTTYKMGKNYAPIINRINSLSEKVLRSKNNKIVT